MLSSIAMKNLLFAAWKNSSQPKIGQFEILVSVLLSICSVTSRLEAVCKQHRYFMM